MQRGQALALGKQEQPVKMERKLEAEVQTGSGFQLRMGHHPAFGAPRQAEVCVSRNEARECASWHNPLQDLASA